MQPKEQNRSFPKMLKITQKFKTDASYNSIKNNIKRNNIYVSEG